MVRHKLCEVNGKVTAVGRVAQPARGADGLLLDLSRVDIVTHAARLCLEWHVHVAGDVALDILACHLARWPIK